jgi:hypothetical protein
MVSSRVGNGLSNALLSHQKPKACELVQEGLGANKLRSAIHNVALLVTLAVVQQVLVLNVVASADLKPQDGIAQ